MSAIPGVPVTGIVVPQDSIDDYPVTDPQYQVGGYRTVADLTARDAITVPRRRVGMQVYVVANLTTYRLGAGLTNGDWAAATGTTVAISDVTGLQTALDAKAALASPVFTGAPQVPTAAANTNTPQAASTAFVQAQIAVVDGGAPSNLNTLDKLAASLGDDPAFATTVAGALGSKAPVASPGFTGVPTGPTATVGTNTTQLATTAFVIANAGSGGAGGAPLNSPAFTGTPTAPTAAGGTNTSQLATCLFVANAVAALLNSAPSSLDTLAELASAINNDPAFATAMTTALAGKQNLATSLTALSALTPSSDRMPYFDGAGSAATATLTTLARTFLSKGSANNQRNTVNSGISTPTDATTIATNCANGNVFEVTLGGNRTLGAPTNVVAGATYIWIIRQPASGGPWTLALNAAFKLPTGVTWLASTGAGKVDIISAVADSAGALYVVPTIGF